jgi:hypothetical protein
VTKPFSNVELLDRVQVWPRARGRMHELTNRLLCEQAERLRAEGLAPARGTPA